MMIYVEKLGKVIALC